MKIAALFLWLLVPLGLWGAIWFYGTPHVAVSYTFHDNGRPYDPLAHRDYVTCTWVGWEGMFTLPAEHSDCPWVRFFRAGP